MRSDDAQRINGYEALNTSWVTVIGLSLIDGLSEWKRWVVPKAEIIAGHSLSAY